MIGEKIIRNLISEWFEYIDGLNTDLLSALEKIYDKLVSIEGILLNIQKENENGNSPDIGNRKDRP